MGQKTFDFFLVLKTKKIKKIQLQREDDAQHFVLFKRNEFKNTWGVIKSVKSIFNSNQESKKGTPFSIFCCTKKKRFYFVVLQNLDKVPWRSQKVISLILNIQKASTIVDVLFIVTIFLILFIAISYSSFHCNFLKFVKQIKSRQNSLPIFVIMASLHFVDVFLIFGFF